MPGFDSKLEYGRYCENWKNYVWFECDEKWNEMDKFRNSVTSLFSIKTTGYATSSSQLQYGEERALWGTAFIKVYDAKSTNA